MPRRDCRNFPLYATPPSVLPHKAWKLSKNKATVAKKVPKWSKYIDKDGSAFLPTKPEGKGAINLLNYTIGDEKRKPDLDDVKKLNNTDFTTGQTNLTMGISEFMQNYELPTAGALRTRIHKAKKPWEVRQ